MSKTPSSTPRLKSHISPNIFLHVPASLSQKTSSSSSDGNGPRTKTKNNTIITTSTRTRSPPRIIFFVTGNPGLIAYYHTFLSLLSTRTWPATRECVVAGFSLGGFEVDGGLSERGVEAHPDPDPGLAALQFPFPFPDGGGGGGGPGGDRIYGLEAQIELTERRVWALVRRVSEVFEHGGCDVEDNSSSNGSIKGTEGSQAKVDVEVVLLGHSVGAYIVLELIRRCALQKQQQQQQQQRSQHGGETVGFQIKGAILLTPTIVNIAHSSSGRALTPLVTFLPGFAALMAVAARGLVGLLSKTWLRGLVARATGMPDRDGEGDVGMSALDATVAFLTSARGVRQALELAGEEMRMIGEDGWGQEVWGGEVEVEVEVEVEAAARATRTDVDDGRVSVDDGVLAGGLRRPPKLTFYFAKTDHWVADETREELLKVRGRLEGKGEDWRPTMIVDEEDGLVHGWCIRQSELVAGKVGKWIGEIWGDC